MFVLWSQCLSRCSCHWLDLCVCMSLLISLLRMGICGFFEFCFRRRFRSFIFVRILRGRGMW